MTGEKTYLGVPVAHPRVAFFEFTSCEGCQLQILNNEATLLDFLALVEVVNFREAMTERSDEYDVALVEGSISRADEAERLVAIRNKAKILVAIGSCAAFGGVNRLKNRFENPEWVKEQVYGRHPIETEPVRSVAEVVKVDLTLPGCPIKKEEVEAAVMNLVLGRPVNLPVYPVCMECKARENVCLFDLGEPCMGPVTRAGCDAWCPSNRFGCWGCRGPSTDANVEEWRKIMKREGVSTECMNDRLECFGGFREFMEKKLKTSPAEPAPRQRGKRGKK